jgi:hypothetical protein
MPRTLESPPAPQLRVLPGRSQTPASFASCERAWTLLFGVLCASGGHGLFLACALTRLEKLPSRAELGDGLELLVLAWFVLAGPLALLAARLRGRIAACRLRFAWTLATGAALASAAAFALYLRAIALA